METKLLFQDAAAFPTPMLAVFAVDIATEKGAEPVVALLTTSDAVADAATRFLEAGEFKATLGETLLLHAPSGLKADRLLVIGLGKAKGLHVDAVRKGAGVAVRAAKPRGVREVAIAFPEDRALSDEPMESLPCGLLAKAVVEGAELADADYDTYKSDRKDRSLRGVSVLARADGKTMVAEIEAGFGEGLVVASAQNFARALVNEPGNVLTPTELGKRAQAMCSEVGIGCDVYSTETLHELGMGAFWAVSQGSEEPPALIVMTYEPEGGSGSTEAAGAEGSPVFGLVGKGITFDTGGISIKPADGMEKMKYDMAGAAAMIGAMRAIAGLKLPCKVISVVCSAENMPDGKAFKPGDVVTAMSGKTIEVVNTDAEGRLVLADGLHYAKTLGCTHLVDAATLTGAIGIALGRLNVGLFSNDDETADRFLEAGRRAGEKFWPMPCTDDYKDQIKSSIADIQNTGLTRYGGATNAAMFLKEFVGETPWVHLDIASMAWDDEGKAWAAKGPTGVAVRSIVEWVRGYGG